MADGIKVEVKGLRQLAAGMDELGGNIADAAGLAFRDVADSARAATAARVPQRSGRMAASVSVNFDEAAHTASVVIGEGVPYAGWIEFGGGRYKGRPYIASGRYLFPSTLDASHELQPAGERAARAEIGRMHWPAPR